MMAYYIHVHNCKSTCAIHFKSTPRMEYACQLTVAVVQDGGLDVPRAGSDRKVKPRCKQSWYDLSYLYFCGFCT